MNPTKSPKRIKKTFTAAKYRKNTDEILIENIEKSFRDLEKSLQFDIDNDLIHGSVGSKNPKKRN